MGVKTLLDRLRSGESNVTNQQKEPSHVCRACGETFRLDPDAEIQACRGCGSDRVERTDRGTVASA